MSGAQTSGCTLITGAAGFVGRAVCAEFLRRGWYVRTAARVAGRPVLSCENVVVGDLARGPRWERALDGVNVVVHLAARIHDLSTSANVASFHAVNCDATERLARAAAMAGARRLIFLSSVKVNGDSTLPGARLVPFAAPHPQGPYAVSKWQAEMALSRVAAETGLEVVVIRSPLVYGPGVGANFLRLVRLVDRQVPLPLKSIRNQRSLIYVGNLAEVIALCAAHKAAIGQTLLVADGEDLSTPELVAKLAAALGVEPRLIAFPEGLLRLFFGLIGRSADIARLLDSLSVDATHAMRSIGWQPRFSLDEGIMHTVRWYRSMHPCGAAVGAPPRLS